MTRHQEKKKDRKGMKLDEKNTEITIKEKSSEIKATMEIKKKKKRQKLTVRVKQNEK